MREETMDAEKQIGCLNDALRLQHRSVLHYSLVAGSVIGLEYQAAAGAAATVTAAHSPLDEHHGRRTAAVKELGFCAAVLLCAP
jgi:hypothetical protein